MRISDWSSDVCSSDLIAFTVRGGIAAADPILIDTKKNVMLGRGGFSFRSEAIDMAVRADGKTFSLFSGQSPIGVAGYFAAPTVDPISDEMASRAGAGTGLGLLASLVGLIIPVIDPGDAKANRKSVGGGKSVSGSV